MLYLDHDIIFYFSNIEKIQEKFDKSFENIMENGAFAKKSKCSIFHNIFKYMYPQHMFWLRNKKKYFSVMLSYNCWHINIY